MAAVVLPADVTAHRAAWQRWFVGDVVFKDFVRAAICVHDRSGDQRDVTEQWMCTCLGGSPLLPRFRFAVGTGFPAVSCVSGTRH